MVSHVISIVYPGKEYPGYHFLGSRPWVLGPWAHGAESWTLSFWDPQEFHYPIVHVLCFVVWAWGRGLHDFKRTIRASKWSSAGI